jgi:hypothetical protein
MTLGRMGPAEITRLQRAFQDFERAEARGAFMEALRSAGGDPHRTETMVVSGHDGQPSALFAFDFREPRRLVIPLLRIRRSRLTDGLAEHIAWRAIVRARDEGCSAVIVRDQFVAPAAEAAFEPL